MPESNRKQVKDDVGEFVVLEILKNVSTGKSPVKDRGSFEKLDAEYAKDEKGGNRTANLDLEGDMLDALKFKQTANGIDVGIFKASQVPKADGHNNFSGESKLPTRRFIPKDDEIFKPSIEAGIKRIVKQAEVVDGKKEQTDEEILENFGLNAGVSTTTADTTSISFAQLFDDKSLRGLF